ncbi:MAG: DUF2812 domain-containing protein [Firmicutes bacterium]|nr:DUF2812 domain-containing protein [Bacillota bacterium]
MPKQSLRRQGWWLEQWQLGEQEAWLEAMSAQGWHLVKTDIGRATFQRGEPQNYRYRCDIFKADSAEGQDRLNLYSDVGWEHVANRGWVQIFRAPTDASIPEIHTDPEEHARSIRKLIPGYIFSGLMPWLLLLFGILVGKLKLADVLIGMNWVGLLGTLFFLWWVSSELIALVRLLQYMARVRRAQRPATPVQWQRQIRRAKARVVPMVLTVMVLVGYRIASAILPPPPYASIPAGDLPVIRLSQVLGSSLYDQAIPHKNNVSIAKDMGDLYNFYRQGSSLLVPEQHFLAEAIELPSETRPDGEATYSPRWYYCDAYRAASPQIATALAPSLARERHFYFLRSRSPLKRAAETHGFDGLWVLEDNKHREVIARQGEWVYYLSYRGSEPLELLIQALQDHLRSE